MSNWEVWCIFESILVLDGMTVGCPEDIKKWSDEGVKGQLKQETGSDQTDEAKEAGE